MTKSKNSIFKSLELLNKLGIQPKEFVPVKQDGSNQLSNKNDFKYFVKNGELYEDGICKILENSGHSVFVIQFKSGEIKEVFKSEIKKIDKTKIKKSKEIQDNVEYIFNNDIEIDMQLRKLLKPQKMYLIKDIIKTAKLEGFNKIEVEDGKLKNFSEDSFILFETNEKNEINKIDVIPSEENTINPINYMIFNKVKKEIMYNMLKEEKEKEKVQKDIYGIEPN